MRNEKIQIDRLNNAKAAIAEAIAAKGVQVPESTKLDGYPTLISQISTSGSGGGKSVRTCRIVVGTSTAGWTENDCDYLCDGTSDEVKIQAAIDALPEDGGEIVLLDGDYNTSTVITLKAHTTLSGGANTSIIQTNSAADGMIVMSDCVIQKLNLYNNAKTKGPTARTSGIIISGSNVTVQNNQIYGYTHAGIRIGSETGTIDTIQILHNHMRLNNGDVSDGFGISFNANAKCIDIVGNYISSFNVGIDLKGVESATISNNYFEDFQFNSVCSDANSENIKITNNTCTTTWGGLGVEISGNGFVIAQNIVLAKSETDTAIKLNSDCINVLVSNNYIYGSPVTTAGKHSMVVNNIYWESRDASGGGTE